MAIEAVEKVLLKNVANIIEKAKQASERSEAVFFTNNVICREPCARCDGVVDKVDSPYVLADKNGNFICQSCEANDTHLWLLGTLARLINFCAVCDGFSHNEAEVSPTSGEQRKQNKKEKAHLLDHYAKKEPTEFYQYDAFTDAIEGSVMKPDKDGVCLFSGNTTELMSGGPSVRVLISRPRTSCKYL